MRAVTPVTSASAVGLTLRTPSAPPGPSVVSCRVVFLLLLTLAAELIMRSLECVDMKRDDAREEETRAGRVNR